MTRNKIIISELRKLVLNLKIHKDSRSIQRTINPEAPDKKLRWIFHSPGWYWSENGIQHFEPHGLKRLRHRIQKFLGEVEKD
jgi:hypothetical protein